MMLLPRSRSLICASMSLELSRACRPVDGSSATCSGSIAGRRDEKAFKFVFRNRPFTCVGIVFGFARPVTSGETDLQTRNDSLIGLFPRAFPFFAIWSVRRVSTTHRLFGV